MVLMMNNLKKEQLSSLPITENISDDVKYNVVVSSVDEEKNPEMIADALKRLKGFLSLGK